MLEDCRDDSVVESELADRLKIRAVAVPVAGAPVVESEPVA